MSSFFLWSFKQRDSFHIQILMIFFFGKVHIASDFEIIEFDYPRYGSLMDCYYKIFACLNNRTGNQLCAIANISLHCMYRYAH